MAACGICGKPIALCCDIYDRYEDENGNEVIVCGDCIQENDLEIRKDNNP